MATHAGRRLPGSSGACYAYPRSIWKTSSTPPWLPLQGGTMSGCFPFRFANWARGTADRAKSGADAGSPAGSSVSPRHTRADAVAGTVGALAWQWVGAIRAGQPVRDVRLSKGQITRKSLVHKVDNGAWHRYLRCPART